MTEDVAITATAKRKFKAKKATTTSKAKSSKPSSRKNSFKSRRHSFLEQNIKLAGNKDFHRRSITKNDESGANNTVTVPNVNAEKAFKRQNSSQFSTSRKQSIVTITETKTEETDPVRLHYLQEQQDLHRAYSLLLNEYKRKLEIRKNLREKIRRANKNLKVLLGSQKTLGAREGGAAQTETIKGPLLVKHSNKNQSKKNRTTMKHTSYDRPDRI